MRIGWLLGWAVPEAWFAPLARGAFPDAEHAFAPAAPGAGERLAAAGPFDWLAGYSLGSLLLLGGAAASGLPAGRVALLAPIFAFSSEEGLGGRVPRAAVRRLARRLRSEPAAALADFYARAGLDIPRDRIEFMAQAGGAEVGPGVPPGRGHAGRRAPTQDVLSWGLDQLETARVEPPLPAGWLGWCGSEDPLLDAARLRELSPGIATVPGASHHPGALLRAFAEEAARG